MRFMRPMTLKERYYAAIEREIQHIFDDLIYRPLFAALGKNEFTNAIGNALLEALRIGIVWYDDGHFHGRFNAAISSEIRRIGGQFNAKSGLFKLPSSEVPAEARLAQASADVQFRRMHEALVSALSNIDAAAAKIAQSLKERYEQTLSAMEKDLQGNIASAARHYEPEDARSRITIEAKLTDAQKSAIAGEWAENLSKYIKGWTDDNILKLREDIQSPVLAGGRAQSLVKGIEENYQVGRNKAKFLARQETALLMSKLQETRYRDMGITRYRWSTGHDTRVRHDHNLLNGNVYSFSSPPITNRKTGARNNPGEDFNCRCVAIPLID